MPSTSRKRALPQHSPTVCPILNLAMLTALGIHSTACATSRYQQVWLLVGDRSKKLVEQFNEKIMLGGLTNEHLNLLPKFEQFLEEIEDAIRDPTLAGHAAHDSYTKQQEFANAHPRIFELDAGDEAILQYGLEEHRRSTALELDRIEAFYGVEARKTVEDAKQEEASRVQAVLKAKESERMEAIAVEHHGEPEEAADDEARPSNGERVSEDAWGKILKHGGPVPSIYYSPDGTTFASVSLDGNICLWNPVSGFLIREARTSTKVERAIFSSDGTRAVLLTRGPFEIWILDPEMQRQMKQRFKMGQASVRHFAFSPDGRRFAAATNDTTIVLRDAKSGALLVEVPTGHTAPIATIAFSPDGTRFVSGAYDCTIRLWDATSGSALSQVLKGHAHPIQCVLFSPNGAQIASCDMDGTIWLWDTETATTLRSLRLAPTTATASSETVRPSTSAQRMSSPCIVFAHDGALIAQAKGYTLCLWDPTHGDVVAEALHTSAIECIAFSPDMTVIASGTQRGAIYLWTVPELEEVVVLEGHYSNVERVVFSPDSEQLASCSRDGTVRLWGNL